MRVIRESNGVRLVTRQKPSVDFGQVPEHQREIDKRCWNWARWCEPTVAGLPGMSPMFRGMPRVIRHEPGTPLAEGVDAIDAAQVAKAVAALPEKLRLVMAWNYVNPTSPVLAAKAIGVPIRDLQVLLNRARQMLIDRGC